MHFLSTQWWCREPYCKCTKMDGLKVTATFLLQYDAHKDVSVGVDIQLKQFESALLRSSIRHVMNLLLPVEAHHGSRYCFAGHSRCRLFIFVWTTYIYASYIKPLYTRTVLCCVDPVKKPEFNDWEI